MYNYKGTLSGILFSQLLVKPCNCEHEVKDLQDLCAVGLWKYGTTIDHVLRVISCICTLFFNTEAWWCLRAHWHGRNDSHDLPQGGLGLPQL